MSQRKKTLTAGECIRLIGKKGICDEVIREFRRLVYDHFKKHGRALPWRKDPQPYTVLVSEVMLQQTQVDRVTPKYLEFTARFPDLAALAGAPLKAVLAAWSGLGYNRRALSLRESARIVLERHGGVLPSTIQELRALPGIGRATAASIAAFAFNAPEVFIETNIRAVYLHFFFQDRNGVRDEEILPIATRALDRRNPRRWYNALMDYGAMLKKSGNPGRKSAHYRAQSPFSGSRRQLRGMVIKTLLAGRDSSAEDLARYLGVEELRVREVLESLAREGLVAESKGLYRVR